MGLSRATARPQSRAWVDKWHVAVISVICLLLSRRGSHADSDLVRHTEQGLVRGKIIRLPDRSEVAAFLGIPYAEAPVGSLRFKMMLMARRYSFLHLNTLPTIKIQGVNIETLARAGYFYNMENEEIHCSICNYELWLNTITTINELKTSHDEAPEKRRQWKDILNATSFGDICYQPENFSIWDSDENETVRTLRRRKLQSYKMSEDCLTLNVYTPRIRKHGDYLLPVMVYVHGGSYYMNSGRFYPGEKIASIGVIVVTFNYRLGPLGFLSTGDSTAPGNYGLLDQIEVLKWIQRNIHYFGGDSKNVTLFGNSAGAASITFHLLSPLTKGLFSAMIAQSGCALAPWALQLRPRLHAEKLARDLGCSFSSTRDLVECLRGFTPDLITQKFWKFTGLLVSFAPVIDGPYGGNYLLDHPEYLIRDGHFVKIPFMTGITSDEVSIWFEEVGPEMDLTEMQTMVQNFTKELLQYKNVSELNHVALSHAVMVQYFRKRGVHNYRGKGEIKSLVDFISDVGLKAPCIKLLQHMANHSSKATYMYEFNYFSNDDIKSGRQGWIGSYHESELQYIFGEPHLNYSNSLRPMRDRLVSSFMMKMWINFAKYGNPTPAEHNPLNMTWQPYSIFHRVHLSIVDSPKMEENYQLENILFWNSFFPILSDYRIEEGDSECLENKQAWLIWFLTSLISTLSLTCVMLTIYIIRRRPLQVIKHSALATETNTAV